MRHWIGNVDVADRVGEARRLEHQVEAVGAEQSAAVLDPLGTDRRLMLEAARLAYGVRDTHCRSVAMRQPVPALLDKGFAKRLSAPIDPGKRAPLPNAPTPGSDTVYLTVVDRDRTAVSFINSLYSAFGTGICTEKTGIMLHNRGSGFVVEPGHPNTIDRKAADDTIHSGARHARRTVRDAFGVMGAHYQPMGHVQVVSQMVDYGMDVQAAIDAPRTFYEGDDGGRARHPAAAVAGTERREAIGERHLAVGRGPSDPHRLAARHPDRRFRAAQGRLRARLLTAARSDLKCRGNRALAAEVGGVTSSDRPGGARRVTAPVGHRLGQETRRRHERGGPAGARAGPNRNERRGSTDRLRPRRSAVPLGLLAVK